jgi:hypothetical protein
MGVEMGAGKRGGERGGGEMGGGRKLEGSPGGEMGVGAECGGGGGAGGGRCHCMGWRGGVHAGASLLECDAMR